ncbi:hypothetical protein HMPREF3226_02036 [Prevotella corporis]|uniref:Uncharacterized protein n=1 Tax=Prevotella corporis TaxID=28128 RepID=A0A133PZ43_9BACT|nr:hypothetical protein HMPREF3226_02036 [Prevotella corporis]
MGQKIKDEPSKIAPKGCRVIALNLTLRWKQRFKTETLWTS